MKKALTALLMLLMLLPAAHAQSAVYDIIVEENGDSAVILQIEGKGTFNIPLPLDVSNPTVKGGLYLQAENGIDVSVPNTEKAMIVYRTSLLTSKRGEQWTFDTELPDLESNEITVSLPPNAIIVATEPSGSISQDMKYLKINWNLEGNDTIKAVYTFGEEPLDITRYDTFLIILIAVMVFVIFFLVFLLVKRGKGKPQKMDKAKQHIMKTLSKNEAILLSLLLENEGGLKRNKLEKQSRLAKSSLASTLNSLERKNIIRVDKTYTVHYIELTDWFKSLK
ncbi:hypothetical protein GF351_04540 [Candidatus Woesearchaeota archaeon]|nr:hypothetical protein [Candidatus Woesearchaeota archaeon]